MRIVAGRHRGRLLAAPEGLAVRPTSDRTREALFDILTQGRLVGGRNLFAEAQVLDAFAGSGALGLEALSRGAARVTFMENQAAAITALNQNIDRLGEQARTIVSQADVLRPPRPTGAPCTLVMMDPPYNQGLAAPALEALAGAGWLAPGAMVTVELMKTEPFDPPAGFTLRDQRRYGKTQIVFLEKDS